MSGQANRAPLTAGARGGGEAQDTKASALRRAAGIAALYALVAGLWIWLSDGALGLLVHDPDTLLTWSIVKGIAFVVVTTAMLLSLMVRALTAIERSYGALQLNSLELERLNRLYGALSQINQAVVRSATPDELLDRATQALGEYGAMKRVRIALYEPEAGRLRTVARWGDEGAFAERLEVLGSAEPDRHGPAAHVAQSGVPFVSHDLAHDFAGTQWWKEVERLGLRACASFPMRRGGAVGGLLEVFAETSEVFRDREIELLTQATVDISFALDHLEQLDARRQAEELAETERQFSERMIESMPGIVYFYDEEGRFLRWNRNFEIVSGYSGDEIATMHPTDFFDPTDRPLLIGRIAEVFDRGESSIEAPFHTKSGAKLPYFFTGRRVDYRGGRCLVGVGIDISQRIQAEQALRELAVSLERRVAERTGELKATLVRAEAADRLKSAFLTTMSHELRTPLNSIIGFTGILLQGLAGPLNEEQHRQLGMIRTSGRHLLALINDVLDLSKIEADQLEILAEPFDLSAAIAEAVATISPMADEKQLTLRVKVAPDVQEMLGDRRRVEQILLNLLNNAVKFTVRGEVRLTADRVEVDDCDDDAPAPAIRIVVEDTGVGIDHEHLDTLFLPFRQLDTGLSRQFEGSGLGLAICRHLVDLMGGQITVRSEPLKGSAFTVILPAAGPPHRAAPPGRQNAASPSSA